MNISLRRTLDHLLFLVCIGTAVPLLAQDHIVEFGGNVIHGDVSETFIRKKGEPNVNDKIHFNPEGKGGQKTCGPTSIKGYYLKRLNVFYATKVILPAETYAFFPEFTPGEDSIDFHNVTGLEIKATGKITLYKLIYKEYVHMPSAQPFGVGMSDYARTKVNYYVEKDGKLLILTEGSWKDQLQEKQWLATFIQGDQAFIQRLLYQEKKVTGEFLEECIHHYNSICPSSPPAP
jgi:hypothetical protein